MAHDAFPSSDHRTKDERHGEECQDAFDGWRHARCYHQSKRGAGNEAPDRFFGSSLEEPPGERSLESSPDPGWKRLCLHFDLTPVLFLLDLRRHDKNGIELAPDENRPRTYARSEQSNRY